MNPINQMSNLEREYFMALKHKLLLYKNKLVDATRLIKDLRTEFRVFEHINSMIYESYKQGAVEQKFQNLSRKSSNYMSEGISQSFHLKPDSDRNSNNEHFHVISQFNLLKKFILNNSIPFEDVRLQKIGTQHSKEMGKPTFIIYNYSF